eukprot:3887089-Lingulodinium_polyedra.AAC.1
MERQFLSSCKGPSGVCGQPGSPIVPCVRVLPLGKVTEGCCQEVQDWPHRAPAPAAATTHRAFPEDCKQAPLIADGRVHPEPQDAVLLSKPHPIDVEHHGQHWFSAATYYRMLGVGWGQFALSDLVCQVIQDVR